MLCRVLVPFLVALTVVAAESTPHEPGPTTNNVAIRYRTHISGPIAPVNRQLTQRQKDSSRDRDDATSAGELFAPWTFGLGSSWTWIDDDVIGDKAIAREYYVTADSAIGDTQVGVGLSYDRFTTDNTGLDLKTYGLDGYAIHPVRDWLDLGLMGVVSHSEIDNGPSNIDTYGAGPLAAVHYEPIETLSLGLTTSLNFYDVDGNYDALFAALFDANFAITDSWSLYAFATYNDSQRDTTDDRSFWTIGAELGFASSDRLSWTIGYETTRGFEQYDDHTLLLSGSLSF